MLPHKHRYSLNYHKIRHHKITEAMEEKAHSAATPNSTSSTVLPFCEIHCSCRDLTALLYSFTDVGSPKEVITP